MGEILCVDVYYVVVDECGVCVVCIYVVVFDICVEFEVVGLGGVCVDVVVGCVVG